MRMYADRYLNHLDELLEGSRSLVRTIPNVVESILHLGPSTLEVEVNLDICSD